MMPDERDKASEKRVKWFCQPWSVTIAGMTVGAIWHGLLESGIDQSVLRSPVDGYKGMIVGGFGGAVASALVDQLSRAHSNASKRWRPRFSLSTLVIVVTLFCMWFGTWEAFRNYAVEDAAKDMWWGGSRPRVSTLPPVASCFQLGCPWHTIQDSHLSTACLRA